MDKPAIKRCFKKILKNSYRVVLSYEEGNLIGFINAISDGVLSAYIPLLEGTPKYQRKNIGKELLARMKDKLMHLYMTDLSCDDSLIPYYETLGMTRSQGACLRNYSR